VSICTVDIQCALQEHKSPAFMAGMKALKMPWDDSEESEDEEEPTPLGPGRLRQQGEETPQPEDREVLDPEEGSVNGGSPERQDGPNDAERALGRSRYGLLMQMVPMMCNLLAEHVPADDLEDFLERHVQNLNDLIMGDQDNHN
jgi:hypothetical protein